ncbi:hypothetical protein SPHINGO8BC_20009 [Sphingobacterium multivorum]|uniref:Uncharacterized protein n=1 Tax=Sphingobacterium multivorum TaxID=28454 RepID=A0A654B8I5_SPHMU|nr:hypothetical protein SPHINGO8BC_20009 [Sphingobacterium multivorum]
MASDQQLGRTRLAQKRRETNSKKLFVIFQFQKIISILDQPVEIYQHLAKRLIY